MNFVTNRRRSKKAARLSGGIYMVEVNRRRNRKSLLQTLIREKNGSEKSWFLQGNACQGNSSKLQSLTAGVCRAFTGMQS